MDRYGLVLKDESDIIRLLLTIKPRFCNSLGNYNCVAIVPLLIEQDINAF